jgi:hypothetical protein
MHKVYNISYLTKKNNQQKYQHQNTGSMSYEEIHIRVDSFALYGADSVLEYRESGNTVMGTKV